MSMPVQTAPDGRLGRETRRLLRCCLPADPRKLQSEIRFFFFSHRISHAAAFACGRGSLSRASARHRTAARDATWPHLHLLHRSIRRRRGHTWTWFLRGYLASAGSIASPVRTAYVGRGVVVGRGRAYGLTLTEACFFSPIEYHKDTRRGVCVPPCVRTAHPGPIGAAGHVR